ncbi:acetyl-CoA carboxylase, carboxyltransferase subunit beta [Sphingoaurantiacus capsulatus]|uniref:Acetyl-coenzyme A carboxylase carboxyl transferase subunit beta n=1 Tax=Sphingoaurantiacus capsulatus TaxID=1771310 RepID=A0ABV7XAY2_9SPHN
MSWLTRLRPKLSFLQKRDTPDNLWHKCKSCGQMIFRKEFVENLSVCPRCEHHERIGPTERFDQVFDSPYERLAVPSAPEDPLKFRDQKRYTDRIKAARAATGEPEAFALAKGSIAGTEAVVGVQNFAFMGGSMGVGVGEAFVAGALAALAARTPYIVFTAAGGARMQEGILSLMQMPRSTVAIAELNEAGLPYIVVLTDPTTGGVTASYAMLGDVQIAEPNALIGFAGQRVIENTIREKLPEGFQRAEYLLEHGMIDMVTHRRDLRDTLGRLIGMLAGAKAAA